MTETPASPKEYTMPSPAEVARECRDRFFSLNPDTEFVVTTNPQHIGYLTGYRSIMLDADRTYRKAAVVSRTRSWIVTGASDAGAAFEHFQDASTIYRHGNFVFYFADSADRAFPATAATFEDALRRLVTDSIGNRKCVAIDVPDPETRRMVADLLSDDRPVDAQALFRSSRLIKTGGELHQLRTASAITEAAMLKAVGQAHEGMSELDISGIISGEIVKAGGIPRFIVVTSGERSAYVDAYASSRRLGRGDLLRLDLGATYQGYWADMARTFVMGGATLEQERRYEALRLGEAAQLEMVRPGIAASDLFDVAIESVRSNGFDGYDRHHCGHAIGLAANEFPQIAAGSETVLEPGMTFCVETPYYELGWGGMMVEDTVIVTETGAELLTHSDRSLRVI